MLHFKMCLNKLVIFLIALTNLSQTVQLSETAKIRKCCTNSQFFDTKTMSCVTNYFTKEDMPPLLPEIMLDYSNPDKQVNPFF